MEKLAAANFSTTSNGASETLKKAPNAALVAWLVRHDAELASHRNDHRDRLRLSEDTA